MQRVPVLDAMTTSKAFRILRIRPVLQLNGAMDGIASLQSK